MKRIITVFLLLLVIITSGCDSTRKPETINQKQYDLSYQNELNGTSEILDSYDKYQTVVSKYNIDNFYDQKYFVNSVLVSVYVTKTNDTNLAEITKFEKKNNQLIIDIKTMSVDDSCDMKTTLIFLELDTSYINEIKYIRIFKDDVDITNIKLNPSYKFFETDERIDGDYSGISKVISSKDELLKCVSEETIYNYYQDFDYENKSLVFFKYHSGTIILSDDLWVDLLGSVLNINFKILDHAQLAVSQNYFVFIEVDKEIVEFTKQIKIYYHDYFDDSINDISKNQYDLLHAQFFQHSGLSIEFVNDFFVVIDSYSELTNHFDNLIIKNYNEEFFENGSIIVYLFEIPSNYSIWNVQYYILDNKIFFTYNYEEIEGNLPLTEICVYLDTTKEIANQITNCESVGLTSEN